jgi:membrane-associated phospholipid phosphatase
MALGAVWRITGATTAFAVLAILAPAAEHGSLSDADRALFEVVRARRGPARTAVARAVSTFGEPAVACPILTVVAALATRRAGWRRAYLPCLAVVGGAAVRRRLSRVIARPRPPADAWLTEPEGYSLPSKHTTLAALTAGACVRILGLGSIPAHAATLLAAAGVGASRVYLGVHWPADVAAGWLFAEGWLCLAGPGA